LFSNVKNKQEMKLENGNDLHENGPPIFNVSIEATRVSSIFKQTKL